MRASTVKSWVTRLFFVAYAVLGVMLLASQFRILHSISSKITEEDQTLLWFAGNELGHLRFHTPNFYGQMYNTVFEALPGELLSMMGMPLRLASPLGATGIATLCWVALAWASYRQKQYLSAAFALCIPVLLSTQYLILFDALRGVLSGDLLAALAIAAAITLRRPGVRLGVVTALGGLALLWDQATVVVVLPLLAVTLIASLRSPKNRWLTTIAALLGGGAAPVAWWGLQKWFYRTHAYDITAPSVEANFSLPILMRNLRDPGELFGFYSLKLLPSPFVTLATAVLLIFAAVLIGARRGYEPSVASVITVICVLIVLSVPKSLDVHPGIYLSGSRFFLPLPMAVWSIIYYTIRAWKSRIPDPGGSTILEGPPASPLCKERIAVVALAIVTLASFVVSQISFRADAGKAVDISRTPAAIIPLVDAGDLLASCNWLKDEYVSLGADVLVTLNRNVTYACATLDIRTVLQDYDRRGWVLQDAKARLVTRILVVGWSCDSFASVGTCATQKSGTLLVTTPPRSLAATMKAAGLPIAGT